MILKEIYVYPDLVEFPQELTSSFRDYSRHICNYLERALRLIKFETKCYYKLAVIGCSDIAPRVFVNSSGALGVKVSFKSEQYLNIPIERVPDYISDMLRSGINACPDEYPLPKEQLLAALDELRGADFKNGWVHKEKKSAKLDMLAQLYCSMTMQSFSLKIRVYQKGKMICQKELLRTVPDEIVFLPKLREYKALKLSSEYAEVHGPESSILARVSFG